MRDLAATDDLRIPLTSTLVIVLIAVLVFLIGVKHPYYNWDVVGYVAAAYYEDGLRGEVLRDRTYDTLRNEVDKTKFEHLIEGPYRQTVFEDTRALEQQVPFYSVKIIYVELVRAAGRTGLSYAQGTFWISALFS